MTPTPEPRPVDASSVTPGEPWGPIETFEQVTSTNDEVRSRPQPWRVVVAERQSGGRGRLGRAWTTTPGTALAVSTLVLLPSSGPSWVPLLAGLAVHRAVTEVAGVVTSPQVAERRAGAPATATASSRGCCASGPSRGGRGARPQRRRPRDDLPLDTATSLRVAGAPGVDRERLLTAYLTHLALLAARRHGSGRRRPHGIPGGLLDPRSGGGDQPARGSGALGCRHGAGRCGQTDRADRHRDLRRVGR